MQSGKVWDLCLWRRHYKQDKLVGCTGICMIFSPSRTIQPGPVCLHTTFYSRSFKHDIFHHRHDTRTPAAWTYVYLGWCKAAVISGDLYTFPSKTLTNINNQVLISVSLFFYCEMFAVTFQHCSLCKRYTCVSE